jgi:hypothetical protein
MNFSDLSKTLYEEKLSSEISSKVIESLAKIAELYWEKIPLEKRRRVILRKELDGKNTLTIEYMPKTSFELMEYAKKDSFDLKKKVEIKLEEEARKLMYDLYRSGGYFRFRTYVKRNLIPPEEVLVRMGYGKRIYEILKNSLNYLFIRQEQKIKKALPRKEILKIMPFLFLVALFFFVSSSTTGFVSLPSQGFNIFFFLLFLLFFLLFYLFFY